MIEARARERLERERAEYEAKLEARAEKAEKTGRKPGGRPPGPPVAGPGPTSDKSSRRWKRSPAFPRRWARPRSLLADSGYFSEANVNACAEAEIAPLITPGRERHHSVSSRKALDPMTSPHRDPSTPILADLSPTGC